MKTRQLFLLTLLTAPTVASAHALDVLWLDVMIPVTLIAYILACVLLYRELTPKPRQIAMPWMVCFSIIVIPAYIWPGFVMLTSSNTDIFGFVYDVAGMPKDTFYGLIYPWGLPLGCWIAICAARYFKHRR